YPFYAQRRALLRLFGAEIGRGVVIKPHVNIKYPWNLKVGNNVWIGEKVWIDNLVMVELQNNVCLSQGAMLITGNHDYTKSTFDLITGKIVLQEGAWVGAGAKVGPGTTLGSHAVLTMGSVASGTLEPYSIYQGTPAVKIKNRVLAS
ncbi:MAG: colanic acid biosynthesis acetyltransferase WcaF, partial [Bacteroidia bacterium]